MAGELVKWLGGGLVKRSSSALQRSRAAREAAELALNTREPVTRSPMDRRMKEAMKVREQMRSFDIFGVPPVPEVYDLPRMCSVRKLPYMSRYILRGDRYEYMQDVRHKQGMNAVEYDSGWTLNFSLAEEVCAWCRAWGKGAVFCRRCETWCCYGQVAGGQGRCGNCGGEWRRIEMGEVEVIGFALKR